MGNRLKHITLCSSYARGSVIEDREIDLFIVFENKGKN